MISHALYAKLQATRQSPSYSVGEAPDPSMDGYGFNLRQGLNFRSFPKARHFIEDYTFLIS